MIRLLLFCNSCFKCLILHQILKHHPSIMKLNHLIFALLLTLFNLNEGFSQKCEVKKDPITGEKLITANFRDKWVYMENKGDQTKFSVVKGYLGELNVIVPIGSEFIIKLDNDEIIKLTTTSESAPNSYASQGVVYTNYTFETILDKETIAKMSTHLPVLIRVPDLKSGERDIVDKKYFKAATAGAKFIMEN